MVASLSDDSIPNRTDGSVHHATASIAHSEQDERLTSIGKMTAEFSHQIRTPLAAALLYAGQLKAAVPDQARIAGKIVDSLHELKHMVDDMLGYAGGARRTHDMVNVESLLHEVRDAMRDQLKPGTRISVSVSAPNLEVAANRHAIKGALLNLVSNADQAGSVSTNILLHAHRYSNAVHVCVTDDGPGIPDEIKPRLFEPFFTTRPQGTGLGLAVVKAVADAHDGEVVLHTSELGSSFALQLPAERDPGLLR